MIIAPKVYKSTQVARRMIELVAEQGKAFTPMQLIKLVYLAHSWMLALYNRPLIEEGVEAWKYGPVIPALYHKIKYYRSNPVKDIECEPAEIDKEALDIIEQTCEKYGCYNGIELSILTHETDSPWELTWKSGKTIISNDLITYYYQKLTTK